MDNELFRLDQAKSRNFFSVKTWAPLTESMQLTGDRDPFKFLGPLEWASAHHLLSPVIKLGICNPRKTERKRAEADSWPRLIAGQRMSK